MKKFLVIVIFLIPVIVIIAIQGTGMVIQAYAPPVNAESIEIRDSFNEVVSDGGRVIVPRFMKDGSDGYAYIYINVYPSVAFSDEIGFFVSEEEGYNGKCELKRVKDSKYKLTAKKNGSVLMRIFSKTNDNAYAMLNIYVTSELITDMSIYTLQDNQMTKIDEGQQTDYHEDLKFYAYACPGEAIGNNIVRWESNNEDIATVDFNGKIQATGTGRAKITATLNDKTGNEHFTFVYVNIYYDMITRFGSMNISKDFLQTLSDEELKDYILENVVLINNSEDETKDILAEDIKITSQNDKRIVLDIKGKEFSFIYVDSNKIRMESDYINDIYMENGGYTLITKYVDYSKTGKPDVNYIISDKSILKVENNRIVPLKEGQCIVYAVDKNTGEKTDSIYINVKRRAYSFQLNLSNMDNIRGIKRERVWGQFWFDSNNKLTNTYSLSLDKESIHPYTDNLDLLWQTNNSEYATINNHGKITFKPESVGKEVTVTATALVHGIKTELSRSYTFLMSSQQDTVNVYNLSQIEEASSNNKRSVALQSSVTSMDKEIKVNNSVYGNGFLFNFVLPVDGYKYRKGLSICDSDLNEDIDQIILENFTLQCGDNYLEGCDKGEAMYLYDLTIPCSIKYIIARYAYNAIVVRQNNSVMTIEGCILGNTGLGAIFFSHDYIDDLAEAGTITVKNCVFRETGCASLVTTPKSMDTSLDKNYIPNIKIEGFIDSYNWKKTSELHGIFNSIDPSSFGDLAGARNYLSELLASMLEGLLEQEEYKRLVYIDQNGEKWVSMNMFALGLSENIDPEAFDLTKAEELQLMPLSIPTAVAKILKPILKFEPNQPCYLLSYKFNNENGPVIKPNDACPENEELFERLTQDKNKE